MKRAAFTAAALMAATTIHAQGIQDWGYASGISSFGTQVEGTYAIQPGLDLRGFGAGVLTMSTSETYEDDGDSVLVEGNDSLGGYGLMADYYWKQSGFRLSLGMFMTKGEIEGTFYDDETYKGTIAFDRSIAPVITAGYRKQWNSGYTLAGELGAIGAQLEASSTSSDPAVQSDIADLNSDLSDMAAIPYLSVTFGYQF